MSLLLPSLFRAPRAPALLVTVLAALLLAGCETAPKTASAGGSAKKEKVLLIAASSDAKEGELQGTISKERLTDLIPGAIPKRVRYKAADEALVARCADSLRDPERTLRPELFSGTFMVFPGAWEDIKRVPGLDLGQSKHVQFPRDDGSKDEGRIFNERHGLEQVCGHLRQVLGPKPRVRALSSDEMSLWWIYIPFDITEPVFVLEAEDHSRHYIVSFGKGGQIDLLDELFHYARVMSAKKAEPAKGKVAAPGAKAAPQEGGKPATGAAEAPKAEEPTPYQKSYYLQHRLFPQFTHSSGGAFHADLVARNLGRLSKALTDLLGERAKQLRVEVEEEGALVLIIMPAPLEPVECYYAAVLKPQKGGYRYLTLEKTHELEGTGIKACLCEWTPDSKHLNHGGTADTSLEGFRAFAKAMLKGKPAEPAPAAGKQQ